MRKACKCYLVLWWVTELRCTTSIIYSTKHKFVHLQYFPHYAFPLTINLTNSKQHILMILVRWTFLCLLLSHQIDFQGSYIILREIVETNGFLCTKVQECCKERCNVSCKQKYVEICNSVKPKIFLAQPKQDE